MARTQDTLRNANKQLSLSKIVIKMFRNTRDKASPFVYKSSIDIFRD